MPPSASFSFSGYIGHYHLTTQKWDPGPFDFKDFCRKLRGQNCFALFPRMDPKKGEDRPLVPEKPADLRDDTTELYKLNEQRADGGFFPVGPWGEARLWHGGVHIVGRDRAPVFAPFPGRIVAARMGKDSPIGSVNFVLMRHDMTLAASKVQFYSLYMHLANELNEPKPPEWMTKEGWKDKGKAGDVVLLDEPVDAGTLIGHVGKAGPPEISKSQVHVEFFSTAELFTGVPSSPWQVIDGTAGGRFCDVDQINRQIDGDKDGKLSKTELSQFYASNPSPMRYLVTLHVSEWTAEPDWSEALRVPKDFKKYKPAEIDQLVADHITPGLWWNSSVAAHCRLPSDGVVYHYNPITFLGWFNQQLLDAAMSGAAQPAVNAADAKEVPKGITDDFGDKDGTTMRSSGDVADDPCNQKLGLQELVQGFDAPECGP
jgi:hypothetical protein